MAENELEASVRASLNRLPRCYETAIPKHSYVAVPQEPVSDPSWTRWRCTECAKVITTKAVKF